MVWKKFGAQVPPFGVESEKKNRAGFVHFDVLRKEKSRYLDQIFPDDRGVLGAVIGENGMWKDAVV